MTKAAISYQAIFSERGKPYDDAMRAHPNARRREFELVLDYLQPRKVLSSYLGRCVFVGR